MANQSIIAVPPNLEEPVVLRRFLARLVEQLDVVTGNRAGPQQQYIDQEQLLDTSKDLTIALEQAKENLEYALSQVESLSAEELAALGSRIGSNENELLIQSGRLDNIDILNNQQDSRLVSLEAITHLPDAPSDGKVYGRKDNTWVEIV